MRFEIEDVEATIEHEIANGATRKEVARTYALATRSSWPTDWRRVGRAIIQRWSRSALLWIKRQAYSGECFEED